MVNSTRGLYLESACVGTAPTKLLACPLLRKAFFYGKRAGRLEYRSYVLAEDISERNCAVGVKTAGNYRAVAQYTDLIPESVAEDPVTAVAGTQIRPVKFISVFQKYFVPDPDAPARLLPRFGKSGLQSR